jgi:hypothetical protein
MARPANVFHEDDEAREISFNLIEPSGSTRYFIPKIFQNHIKLHYIKSTMPELMSPLILAIQGATGQGKTFQCLETFSSLNIYVLLVFGFELSSRYEGGPVRKMERLYSFALEHQSGFKRHTVIVIDDFDNSIVSVRNDDYSGYSVNTQLLTDYFMNLPRKIPRGKKPVPLVLTGNNFLGMYEPLARYGRMSFFDWNGPTEAEKIEIVKTIFMNTLSGSELRRVERVVDRFSDQPLAFFNELKNAAYDEFILNVCNKTDDLSSIHSSIKRHIGQVTIEELLKVGEVLLENRPKDFLSPEKRKSFFFLRWGN